MKKFKSIEEYIEVTKQCQANGFKNLNCYLMPNEITNLIKDECLFYELSETTLQIVVKKDRYNKVQWYSKDEFHFLPFEANLPIIADMPYSNKMTERHENFKEKLLSEGFILNSTTTRMSCPTYEIDLNLGENEIHKLKQEEIDIVYQIWEENFDVVQNLLYSKREIENSENEIYVLKNKENTILGAMEIIDNGNYGWVQHIAINKQCQGCGYGSMLESFYINKCKSLGIKTLLLYTIDSNIGAQKFHAKFGFKPDGKYNCQFIYGR